MVDLRWQDIALPECAFHFGRCLYTGGERFAVHRHDFAEAMLVEAGSGRQIVTGKPFGLDPGSLTLIRPNDEHALQAGPDGMVLLNCAFPYEYAVELEERYFPDEPGYYRREDEFPFSVLLRTDALVQAVSVFNQLSGRSRTRFALDQALLNLFFLIRQPYSDSFVVGAPEWLAHACSEMRVPAHLREGVPALVRLAGRSPEHVSREFKRCLGKTPTEWVTGLRLDHAAKLLCISTASVLEIALDCGFENLSWFHRQFRKGFGVTPLKYRKQNLMTAVRS